MGLVKQAAQAASLAAILLSLAVSPAFSAPPVEAFANLPQIATIRLSPDGRHFAAIQPINGRPELFIYQTDLASGTKPVVYGFGDASDEDVIWVSNTRLIAIFSANIKDSSDPTEYYYSHWVRAIALDVDGKNSVVLMKGRQLMHENAAIAVSAIDANDPQHVYVAASSGIGDDNTFLYKVDTTSGDGEIFSRGDRDTSSWLMDGYGQIVSRQEVDLQSSTKQEGYIQIAKGDGWLESLRYSVSRGSVVGVEGLNMQGDAILISRYGDRNTQGLEAIDRETGKVRETVFSDPNYDLLGTVQDERTGRVIGVTYISDKVETKYFGPKLEKMQQSLEQALPGQSVQIGSTDAAHDLYVVRAEDSSHPGLYYFYRPATGQLSTLANEYPNLDPSDLSQTKSITYLARDGMQIHAYLTVPHASSGKNLPTVILPHGGPDDRDYMQFDWLAQFLASRGYAVLQPNFRGSSGYGYQFESAGFGQWGRKMQDDVTDGAKKLIADGIADPKRICIVGASYGGYVALAGATFTPDLYACTVSYAGVSNVVSILGHDSNDDEGSPAMKYWETRIGDRYHDEKLMQAISPAYHADQVRCPILLIHGTADFTVPLHQSESEQRALQKVGRHVELVKLDGDDHYLGLAATRIRMAQEIERFLSANIGN